ncbi:MAG: hypothetical protein ACTHMM_16115 [Agriterribacter sp.]
MKNYIYSLFFTVLLTIAGSTAFAQTKIKDGTVTGSPSLANASAVLELESNNKGFLLPRVALTSTNSFSPLGATHVAGMLVYNTASAGSAPNNVTPGYYYNDGAKWVRLADAAASSDVSKDAWVDDNANTMVKLGTQSDGATARTAGTDVVIKDDGTVGVGTTTPQKTLHINGSAQLTGELNIGGNATTAGSAGTAGQVLVSNGAGAAPSWKVPGMVPGTISTTYYVQGTTAATINQGATGDVLGVTLTHTVPAGFTQTLLFTVTGYAVRSVLADAQASQGVFMLMQGTSKISSAFASSGDLGDLNGVPVPATLLKAVTLGPGTYTFKVQYTAWSDNQIVNFVPSSGYIGYDNDTESMLTKMQVLVYNN